METESKRVITYKDVILSYSNRFCDIKIIFRMTGERNNLNKKTEYEIGQVSYRYSDFDNSEERSCWSNIHSPLETRISGVLRDIYTHMKFSESSYMQNHNKRRFDFDKLRKILVNLVFNSKKISPFLKKERIKKSAFINLERIHFPVNEPSYSEKYTWESDFWKHMHNEVRLEEQGITDTQFKDFELELK